MILWEVDVINLFSTFDNSSFIFAYSITTKFLCYCKNQRFKEKGKKEIGRANSLENKV